MDISPTLVDRPSVALNGLALTECLAKSMEVNVLEVNGLNGESRKRLAEDKEDDNPAKIARLQIAAHEQRQEEMNKTIAASTDPIKSQPLPVTQDDSGVKVKETCSSQIEKNGVDEAGDMISNNDHNHQETSEKVRFQ